MREIHSQPPPCPPLGSIVAGEKSILFRTAISRNKQSRPAHLEGRCRLWLRASPSRSPDGQCFRAQRARLKPTGLMPASKTRVWFRLVVKVARHGRAQCPIRGEEELGAYCDTPPRAKDRSDGVAERLMRCTKKRPERVERICGRAGGQEGWVDGGHDSLRLFEPAGAASGVATLEPAGRA